MNKFLIIALALGTVACGRSSSDDNAAARSLKLSVTDAWARETAKGQDNGGVYLSVNGGGERDSIVSVTSTAAASAEIHNTSMEGGVMRMRPLDGSLEIPAGGTIILSPGGMHIMLVGLKKPLTLGSEVPLTMTFKNAGTKTIAVPIVGMEAQGPPKTNHG